MNLVFLGPPGSGKGTQAARLSSKFGLIHLSTGDMLRDAVKRKTLLGQNAEGFMKRGELVPDSLIISMIEAKISDGELSNGFVLDGFPRTIPQAEALGKMFAQNGMKLDRAILLSVPDEEIVKRLSGRFYCPTCNAGYNYPAALPRVDGICDKDGSALQRRPDDDESVVRNRLEVYRLKTRPIEDYYRQHALLCEIDAAKCPDTVFEALSKVVNSQAAR